MNYLGTLPSACSCRAWFIEIFFPPSTVSSQRFYYIPRQNRSWKQVCRLQFSLREVLFPFPSPEEIPVGVFTVASSLCCGRCDYRCFLASPLGTLTRAAEGKGEEIFLEMEKESLSCRLLSTERFHVASYIEKLKFSSAGWIEFSKQADSSTVFARLFLKGNVLPVPN